MKKRLLIVVIAVMMMACLSSCSLAAKVLYTVGADDAAGFLEEAGAFVDGIKEEIAGLLGSKGGDSKEFEDEEDDEPAQEEHSLKTVEETDGFEIYGTIATVIDFRVATDDDVNNSFFKPAAGYHFIYLELEFDTPVEDGLLDSGEYRFALIDSSGEEHFSCMRMTSTDMDELGTPEDSHTWVCLVYSVPEESNPGNMTISVVEYSD